MSADNLLFWMSARQKGSWQQFRAAVEELHVSGDGDLEGEEDGGSDEFALPLYQVLRFNLQRLGHAEFFAGAGGADWRITAPTLAITERADGWRGTFVGARSLSLLQRLRSALGPARLETTTFAAYPKQIVVTGSDVQAVEAVAGRAGLLLQRNAPAALLVSLPPIDDACVRRPADLPFGAGWKVDRFSPDDLGWRSGTFDEAASVSGGLFRFSLRHQRHVLFCAKGSAYRIPGQVGKYLVLRIRKRRRQVLRYDGQKRMLAVPASCRPPFLIERALVLCSGSPPFYDGGILQYTEISENIAVIAAALLRQELR